MVHSEGKGIDTERKVELSLDVTCEAGYEVTCIHWTCVRLQVRMPTDKALSPEVDAARHTAAAEKQRVRDLNCHSRPPTRPPTHSPTHPQPRPPTHPLTRPATRSPARPPTQPPTEGERGASRDGARHS
eukprot:scaffold86387_cov63-Phaeocystis_antarctica.AAC.1